VPSNTVNYRLRNNLIKDVVTREGYSQTLHEALQIMSTLSQGPRMILQPEQLEGAMLQASLMADAATDDIAEE
jgi:uncharacterized protein YheU (UPF0270 family)